MGTNVLKRFFIFRGLFFQKVNAFDHCVIRSEHKTFIDKGFVNINGINTSFFISNHTKKWYCLVFISTLPHESKYIA